METYLIRLDADQIQDIKQGLALVKSDSAIYTLELINLMLADQLDSKAEILHDLTR